jgi:hypothetical protein
MCGAKAIIKQYIFSPFNRLRRKPRACPPQKTAGLPVGLHRKEEAMRLNMWEFKEGADLWNCGRMPLEQESGDGYPWIMQKKGRAHF